MKSLLKISILLLVVVLGIASCKKENPAPYFVSDYFPLNIGDKWNFRSYKQEVTKLKTIDSKEYYEVLINQYHADTIIYTSYVYYRKTTDGKVYQLNSELKSESLVYDFTVPVNNSWSYEDGDAEWTVTNVDDLKVVKINNHVIGNCRQFDYDIIRAVDDEHTIILAPGIGRIIGYSYAWGLGDTLRSAVINGVEYSLK